MVAKLFLLESIKISHLVRLDELLDGVSKLTIEGFRRIIEERTFTNHPSFRTRIFVQVTKFKSLELVLDVHVVNEHRLLGELTVGVLEYISTSNGLDDSEVVDSRMNRLVTEHCKTVMFLFRVDGSHPHEFSECRIVEVIVAQNNCRLFFCRLLENFLDLRPPDRVDADRSVDDDESCILVLQVATHVLVEHGLRHDLGFHQVLLFLLDNLEPLLGFVATTTKPHLRPHVRRSILEDSGYSLSKLLVTVR